MSNQTTQTLTTSELIESLVEAITGFSLYELPLETQSRTIKQCSTMLIGYIINYVTAKYGERPALQLKGISIYNTPELFDKFPELEKMFLEGYSSFVNTLQN
jgi:hypothetical protein